MCVVLCPYTSLKKKKKVVVVARNGSLVAKKYRNSEFCVVWPIIRGMERNVGCYLALPLSFFFVFFWFGFCAFYM